MVTVFQIWTDCTYFRGCWKGLTNINLLLCIVIASWTLFASYNIKLECNTPHIADPHENSQPTLIVRNKGMTFSHNCWAKEQDHRTCLVVSRGSWQKPHCRKLDATFPFNEWPTGSAICTNNHWKRINLVGPLNDHIHTLSYFNLKLWRNIVPSWFSIADWIIMVACYSWCPYFSSFNFIFRVTWSENLFSWLGVEVNQRRGIGLSLVQLGGTDFKKQFISYFLFYNFF